MDDKGYLKILLDQFGVPGILNELLSNGITYDSLPYLSEQDINDALKPFRCYISYRAIFREKLFIWRDREVNDMMQTHKKRCVSPIPCFICGKSFLNVDNYSQHLYSDHQFNEPRVPIECRMKNCNKKFTDRRQIEDHIMEKHVF